MPPHCSAPPVILETPRFCRIQHLCSVFTFCDRMKIYLVGSSGAVDPAGTFWEGRASAPGDWTWRVGCSTRPG